MTSVAAASGEKSTFRWLDAARYAVAAAVTVLIMAVIVNAIKVVLRPDSLYLSVTGGSVFTKRFPPPPVEVLAFELRLPAQNPSGRAVMYYVDINAYIFDSNTSSSASSDPGYDSIAYFKPKDIAVGQQEAVESSLHMKMTNRSMDANYFKLLYNGGRMSDVTLRLDGNLITETFGINKTRQITYYCEQLLVGGDRDDEALKNGPDVICRDDTKDL
uniref:Late embryogenesis abundant protein LEA-2 subgroup domain-containing protein n=1 Tax=Arundo donax TaxID=35708 RepID=A0A0A8XP38_ARUDO